MKRLILVAFAAFWTFVAAILALSNIVPARHESPEADVAPAVRRITLAEVSRHDGAQSCWLAIDGAVYDVSPYLDEHPAPPAVLLGWCGREATEAMHTKGYGRDHSKAAWARLESLRIGQLE